MTENDVLAGEHRFGGDEHAVLARDLLGHGGRGAALVLFVVRHETLGILRRILRPLEAVDAEHRLPLSRALELDPRLAANPEVEKLKNALK